MNRTPLIRTLRLRLTVLHGVTLALTLAVFAALAYGALSRTLYRHHDEELAGQAFDLARRLAGGPLTEDEIEQSIGRSAVGSRFVMVRNHHGELLYRDPVLQSTEPGLGQHAALIHAATAGSQKPEFFTVTLERSGDVRFVCVPVTDGAAYVQIGDPIGDVRATLDAVAFAALPLVPIVLLLSSWGGWLIARRALAPMRAITATVEAIHATDLSRRIDVASTDEEVAGLAATLNHLLNRLQRAFDALRQFAGDVSHQIQTPLTVIKASIESARQRSDPSTEHTVFDELAHEVDDISATVADLQTFALADAPLRATNLVNLSHVVAEVADIISALGELKGVDVRSDIAPAITVRGDAVRLKQVVLNLGDNAVKYSLEGGQVMLRLRAERLDAILDVTDTGIGIPEEDLDRVFDRLYRAGRGDRSIAGTGLGLAIAKRIVEVHRGSLTVTSRLGQGSTFTVRLPRESRD